MAKPNNHVQLIGNIGNDIELKGNDKPFVSISLATTDTYKDKNGEWVNNTTWHNCMAFSDLAKGIAGKYTKGNTVIITGSLKYGKYVDKNGIEQKTTTIMVDYIMPTNAPKKDGHSNGGGQNTNYQKPNSNQQFSQQDDDLPF